MTEAETVLVTGGTGFIGSHLSKTLIDDGHEVIAFDEAADTALLNRPGVTDSVRVRRGHVTDVAALARTVRDASVTRIVHLAALSNEDVQTDELAATRVNALGTNNVFEAARLCSEQIERVVVTSSEAVYGPTSVYDGPVTEDSFLLPDSTYSAAKRYGEVLARTYRREYGVPAIALRLTGVFGPFRRSFTEFSDLFEKPALDGSVRVRGGDTAVSWLYVKDAADVFRNATLVSADELTHEIYNVRGEVATVAEAAQVVSELVDDARVEVVDDADFDWAAQRLSLSRA